MLIRHTPGKRGCDARHPQKRLDLGNGTPLPRNGGRDILADRETRTPKQSSMQFREWASILPGKLLVMLAAYADESGTQDRTGRMAKIAVAGGYVASSDEWTVFNDQWSRILGKYDAKFFHFSEWATASAVARKVRRPFADFRKNEYCGWPLKKLNPFLLELAEVASTQREGLFCGIVRTQDFHNAKANATSGIFIGEDPYEYCLHQCFESFLDTVHARWPHFSQPISFVWDRSNKDWRQAIHGAWEPFQKKDSRLSSISFANMELAPFFPLQAADMIAYRLRQLTDKAVKNEHPMMNDIDLALFGTAGREKLQLRLGNTKRISFFG
jgi:hypothetical protein